MKEAEMNEELSPVSEHPVLLNLKNQIEVLEKNAESLRRHNTELMFAKSNYETKVKNCLTYVAEELDGDTETIKNIAEQIGIDLVTVKSFELNVTINIDIEVPFGENGPESGDIEGDIDVSVDSYNYVITDYSTDPIYCNEA